MRVVPVLLIMATSLAWLAGCETSTKLGDLFHANDKDAQATAPPSDPEATGSVTAEPTATASLALPGSEPGLADPGLLGSDPKDDLSLAKRYYRQEDFGLAEHYFRRAVESHPKDGEAWLGLAAAYDRLRRFDLADRAYAQVLKIVGPTAEVLNNQGYSYLLRGDYRRARDKLMAAQAGNPSNPYIINNLRLLEQSAAKAKAVQ